jgi:Domain of unknown function (DUF1816)
MIKSILSKKIHTESASNATELAWWTKIYTKAPFCIYYFGPFAQVEEANDSKSGYIEDLENEGAEVVFIKYLKLNPKNLTVEYKNLSWVRWLHEMMQDSLMLKVLHEPEILRPSGL